MKSVMGMTGMDEASFEACLQVEELTQRVRSVAEAGRGFGVNSTPTFFVNGQMHRGVLSPLLEEARDTPAPAFGAVAPQIRQSLAAVAERRVIDELWAAAEVEKLVPDVAPPREDDGHEH